MSTNGRTTGNGYNGYNGDDGFALDDTSNADSSKPKPDTRRRTHVGGRARRPRYATHSIELPVGGSVLRRDCLRCRKPFCRLLAPGAVAAAFKWCDGCRERAGRVVEGAAEMPRPSEIEYLVG